MFFSSDGSLADSDRAWLTVALGVAGGVYLSYLTIYSYPVHGAGLYLAIAEQISEQGYQLPRTIPHYTADGIPFAYPPLIFYLIAALTDGFGVDPISLTRYLPGLFTIVYLVPYYYIANEFLESPSHAGVATILLALTPVVLKWHLAAGGIVRAAAFLFVLTGFYTGIRLFKTGDRRWLLPSVALFTLTVLTHPVYATFFGLTYLLMFGFFDRSRRGFGYGAVVAIGGLVLAAPWWWQIVSMHGPTIFTAAAGTHDGLGGGLSRLYESFVSPFFSQSQWPFYLLSLAGVLSLGVRRRFFLPVWLLSTGYFFVQDRLLYVAGAMAAAVFLLDVGLPPIRARLEDDTQQQIVSLFVVFLLVGSVVGLGVLTTTDFESGVQTERMLPAPYMDNQDRHAMEWVKQQTAPSARFVVVGDAAELFPFVTDRTNLISPWGVEWKGNAQFEYHKELYDSTSACTTAECLTRSLGEARLHPEYVYVPKEHYTIRRDDHTQSPQMRRSLIASKQYTLVFENRGVMIFRVAEGQ
ncbi:ArnT family glycosyltransferase [Haladaptatus sp. NG-SE-30]